MKNFNLKKIQKLLKQIQEFTERETVKRLAEFALIGSIIWLGYLIMEAK